MASETKGRVAWQNLGGWVLALQTSGRPIMLAASDRDITTRDDSGRLVKITPDHPVARKVVASWNACDSIPLAELERGIVGEMREVLQRVSKAVGHGVTGCSIHEAQVVDLVIGDARALLARLEATP